MNVLKKIGIASVVVAGLFCSFPASAQFFGTEDAAASSVQSAAQTGNKQSTRRSAATVAQEKRAVSDKTVSSFAATRQRQKNAGGQNNKNALQEQQEETEPVFRQMGHVAIETKDKDDDVELIFLYMKNFSIYRTPSGKTRCSMRFATVTTLPEKLSALSCRLKWANMETTLNFIDVVPDVENHFDYTLLGNGCYDMAKQPNIVVNRCRVKGMSQRTCAGKIRWISERR